MKISEKDLKQILKSPLFGTLDANAVRTSLEKTDCRICSYADGEEICSPGATERFAGILLGGKAVVTTPDTHRSTLLRFLECGEAFGISSLFTDAPFASRIFAHGSTRILVMPESAVEYLIEEDRAFRHCYLAFLSGRIQYLNRKIGYLTAGSPERRLALYLLSLQKNPVTLEASISSLSDLLDVGRASLYRAFDRLTEDGFLMKQGRSLTLTNPQKMLDAYR